MEVVRDVLDKLVVDRNGREMGRVDGIELTVKNGHPPHLASILIGPSVLAWRIHPALGRWVVALEHALGVSRGRPVHIDFGTIEIANHIKTDVTVSQTAANAVEQRVRAWVRLIPGSR